MVQRRPPLLSIHHTNHAVACRLLWRETLFLCSSTQPAPAPQLKCVFAWIVLSGRMLLSRICKCAGQMQKKTHKYHTLYTLSHSTYYKKSTAQPFHICTICSVNVLMSSLYVCSRWMWVLCFVERLGCKCFGLCVFAVFCFVPNLYYTYLTRQHIRFTTYIDCSGSFCSSLDDSREMSSHLHLIFGGLVSRVLSMRL